MNFFDVILVLKMWNHFSVLGPLLLHSQNIKKLWSENKFHEKASEIQYVIT